MRLFRGGRIVLYRILPTLLPGALTAQQLKLVLDRTRLSLSRVSARFRR